MPKAISAPLKAHLAQSVTTLASCWRITRTDGVVVTVTDHDRDLVVGGLTYGAADGYSRTALASNAELKVDNLEVKGVTNNVTLRRSDLLLGLFDYAAVEIYIVNWADLTQGVLRVRSGRFGELTTTPTGMFATEIRGLAQNLTQQLGRSYLPTCNADLGDVRCKVSQVSPNVGTATVTSVLDPIKVFCADAITYPPAATTQTATFHFRGEVDVSSAIEISDGTHSLGVVWPTAYNSRDSASFLATVINDAHTAGTFNGTAAVTNTYWVVVTLTLSTAVGIVTTSGFKEGNFGLSSFGDSALQGGLVKWLTGANTGKSMEIKLYAQATRTITLWLAVPFPIVVGDTFWYSVGCDKTRETCALKFNNILNFRGFPDIPGVDRYTYYPDAQS
jgi:uncharacterized phage protein (TIGR02218 family)